MKNNSITYHSVLAAYFTDKSLYFSKSGYNNTNRRKIAELPWQLHRAQEWGKLQILYTDLEFLSHSWEYDSNEVKSFWTSLQRHLSCALIDSYQVHLKDLQYYPVRYLLTLSELVSSFKYVPEALKINKIIAEKYLLAGETRKHNMIILKNGHLLFSIGKVDEALQNYNESILIAGNAGDIYLFQCSIGDKGSALSDLGKMEEAMILLKEQEKICEKHQFYHGLIASLINQAYIEYITSQWDKAIELYDRAEELAKTVNDKNSKLNILGNKSLIYKNRGEMKKALRLIDEVEKIASEISDYEHILSSMINKSMIYLKMDQPDDALEILERAKKIAIQKNMHDSLQKVMGNMALVYKHLKNNAASLKLLKEEEKICRFLKNKKSLAICLFNQGIILTDYGYYEHAEALFDKSMELEKEIGSKDGLQMCLGGKANILNKLGKYQDALLLLQQKAELAKDLGKVLSQISSLAEQAVIYFKLDDFYKALELALQAQQLAKMHGFVAWEAEVTRIIKLMNEKHDFQ